MNDTAGDIKSRLDIVDVVGSYVSLQRSGREHKGLCPFHAEKTPSFTVSQDRQAWYCFGCQEGGDVFTFVEKIEKFDFRQALELLAERAGVELETTGRPIASGSGKKRKRILEINALACEFFTHVLWKTEVGAPGRAVLEQRGVDRATAEKFGIGFAPQGGDNGDALLRFLAKHDVNSVDAVSAGLASGGRGLGRDRFRNRLMFPIRDQKGAVIAFGGRAMGDAVPKYLNSPETDVYHKSSALYGLDLSADAMRNSKCSVVVEGYFDVIACHRAGMANVIASSGTALSKEQVRTIKRYAEYAVLCFDSDPAGKMAASRAVDMCAAEKLPANIVEFPAGVKDPDEWIRTTKEGFVRAVTEARPEWQVLLERAIAGVNATGAPETSNPDEKRVAARNAVMLLARIPEATTRDIYIREAAGRLGVSLEALMSDVRTAVSTGKSAPVRLKVEASLASPALGTEPAMALKGSLVPSRSGNDRITAWEEAIGACVVQRPALVHILVGALGLQPDELRSAGVRKLIEIAQTAETGAAFPIHVLDEVHKPLAARLALHHVLELDDAASPDALEHAMNDWVRRCKMASLRSRAMAEREALRAARQAGREEDVVRHAAQLASLAAEESALAKAAKA